MPPYNSCICLGLQSGCSKYPFCCCCRWALLAWPWTSKVAGPTHMYHIGFPVGRTNDWVNHFPLCTWNLANDRKYIEYIPSLGTDDASPGRKTGARHTKMWLCKLEFNNSFTTEPDFGVLLVVGEEKASFRVLKMGKSVTCLKNFVLVKTQLVEKIVEVG